MRTVMPDELPRAARTLHDAALANQWKVWATEATGTPIDAAGRPQRVTERVETGEVTTAGKPRVQVVTTDELVQVVSHCIRLFRMDDPDGPRLTVLYEDGRFRTALHVAPGVGMVRLGARDAAAVVKGAAA